MSGRDAATSTVMGSFASANKLEYSHRLAWLLAGREIPDGMRVLHKCDNRRCCNVDHLFVGTQADNMADMAAKERAQGQVNSPQKTGNTFEPWRPRPFPRKIHRSPSSILTTLELLMKNHRIPNVLGSVVMFGRYKAKIKVNIKTDCHEWIGSINDSGYGAFVVNGKREFAHRVAMRLQGYTLSGGECVLHKCDNPKCVNPEHLFIGTRMDNNADAKRKGHHRFAIGELQGCAKLTEEAVLEIRASNKSNRKLAAYYGVGYSTIKDARNGKTWKHVQP